MLSVGDILQNRYRIVSPLGQGGMGAVYRAWDARLNTAVAVKEMIPDPHANPQVLAAARAQFQREAQTLANLSHPNLPRVTDYFSLAGNEYLVMDLVEGETLQDSLDQSGGQPLDEAQVLKWTRQLLDALEYCHAHGIIHRDIKPANVRLTPEGRAVLVDFGLVKLYDPTNPKTVTAIRGIGTPEYTPLEQYDVGQWHTDARSDLYSLGATLYHLLTGQAPPTATQRVVNPGSLVAPRSLNLKLSQNTEFAILRAMRIRRHQRFQNAAEMRQALQGKPTKKTAVACPHCGAPLRAGAKFCTACGKTTVPPAPFVFKKPGYRASTIKELVRGCDSYWDEAKRYLYQGDFEQWLRNTLFRSDLADQAEKIRQTSADEDVGLGAFLHLLDPTLPLPALSHCLEVSSQALAFGTLTRGKERWIPLLVRNTIGKATDVQVQSNKPWIRVKPSSFRCKRGEAYRVGIGVDTRLLITDETHRGEVMLAFPTGNVSVPVRVHVEEIPIQLTLLAHFVNVVVGCVLGLIGIGVVGNIVLWIMQRSFDGRLLIYGGLVGGGLFSMAARRIQDSLNLGLSLMLAIILGAAAGLVLGGVVAVLLRVLGMDPVQARAAVGIGALVLESVGVVYVFTHPLKWYGH